MDKYQLEETVWLEKGLGIKVIIKVADTPKKKIKNKRKRALSIFKSIESLLKHIHMSD